jgi:hypothetical protein
VAEFTVPTGKRSKHPRGLPLVARMFASSKQVWEPMAVLEYITSSENEHCTF